MVRLLIILMAVFLISSLWCKSYASDQVTIETKGNQCPAVYVEQGGTSNIYYEINKRFTSNEFEQELEHAPIDVRGKIKYLFNAGILAADEGLYQEAIDHLNNSIKIYPTVSAYIKLSYCYIRLTMYGKANEAFFAARALSAQRDLKPFEEILNNEFLKLLVVYFQPLIEEVKREKGDFVFFGFFETECQWRVVFSASWPDWDKDEALDYMYHKLINSGRMVGSPSLKEIIQPIQPWPFEVFVSAMDPSEELIKDILKSLKSMENTKETTGRMIPDNCAVRSTFEPIKWAYIIIPKPAVLIFSRLPTESSSHAPKANVQ